MYYVQNCCVWIGAKVGILRWTYLGSVESPLSSVGSLILGVKESNFSIGISSNNIRAVGWVGHIRHCAGQFDSLGQR